MRQRKVVFAEVAHEQIRAARAWWVENHRPVEVLVDEIEEAVRFLAWMPGAGTPYPQAKIAGLRRLYLRRASSHLYYTFTPDSVTIRALWHAKREQDPSLMLWKKKMA